MGKSVSNYTLVISFSFLNTQQLLTAYIFDFCRFFPCTKSRHKKCFIYVVKFEMRKRNFERQRWIWKSFKLETINSLCRLAVCMFLHIYLNDTPATIFYLQFRIQILFYCSLWLSIDVGCICNTYLMILWYSYEFFLYYNFYLAWWIIIIIICMGNLGSTESKVKLISWW